MITQDEVAKGISDDIIMIISEVEAIDLEIDVAIHHLMAHGSTIFYEGSIKSLISQRSDLHETIGRLRALLAIHLTL